MMRRRLNRGHYQPKPATADGAVRLHQRDIRGTVEEGVGQPKKKTANADDFVQKVRNKTRVSHHDTAFAAVESAAGGVVAT